jgi:uncharacterized protein with NRDE domain
MGIQPGRRAIAGSIRKPRPEVPGGIPEELETRLAPSELMKHYFIVSPVYGTRCSTVVLMGRDGSIQFIERQFDPNGTPTGTQSFVL